MQDDVVTSSIPTAKLGASGPTVSRVGFGAWTIGGPYEYGWGPVDDDVSKSAILRAVDSGVSWIDTAPAYGCGHSEKVVGAALSQLGEGARPLVFTKCGRVWHDSDPGKVVSDLRPESIRRECDDSLTRLGVDIIDLYQIHRPDLVTGTPLEESWATLGSLVDEGKVRWIGLSNVTDDEIARCEAVRHVDSVQPKLNVLDRDSLALLAPCRAAGTGVLAYSPLASGLLTGKFDSGRIAQLDEGDWRRRSPRFTGEEHARISAVIETLRAIAGAVGCSIVELCIAWALHQEGVTAAIVGARTPDQVDGWIGGATVSLSGDVLAAVDAAASGDGESG